MISEGSCDSEDWSNDAENSAFITEINYILKHIQIENIYFKTKKYFTILVILLYFWSNKCSLGETSFKNTKSYQPQTFEQ